jgi:hypothetical protein
MGGIKDALSVGAQLLNALKYDTSYQNIQSDGRLVEDQDRWIVNDRARDRDFLPHART